MPLRVAFLDQVGATPGGGERTLGTFLAHRPPTIDAHAILLEDGEFADELRGGGIAVDVIAASPSLRAMRRERLGGGAVFESARIALGIADRLRTRQIDVLYTNSMKAHVMGAIASRLVRIPCVMHFHDIVEGRSRALLRLAARLGSRHRIACSQLVANAIDVGETTPVYGPIDVARYRSTTSQRDARLALGVDPDRPTVALIGRINRWKGHDRFVRIAERVTATTRAQFLIVGAPLFRDADFLPELEAMVRERGLDDVVRFIPWVDDVRVVYAASDVNVNCSTREPLGRSPAEAAAAGIPSVVFADSGAAEWLGTAPVAGRIVPPHDERLFADAVRALLVAAPLDEGVRERIRAVATRFDPERIANETAAVIFAAAEAAARA